MSVEAAKIVINVSADGAAKATQDLGKLDGQVGSLDVSIGQLAASSGALAAANALVNFAKATTAAFAEAQSSAMRLEKVAQMKGLDGAAGRVMKLANAMQNLTGSDADATAQISAELLAQGKSEAMIQKMIKAAANLSAVTGDDLATSIAQLNGSLGGMARELGRTNPEIAALTEEQLRSGAAIDIITEKYAGMAESMAGTLEVTTKVREEYANDFTDAIGQSAAPAVSALNGVLIEFYKVGIQALGFFDSLPGPVKASAGALTAMGVAVPLLATAFKAIGPVINMVKVAMIGLAGPAGIVVGVVAAVVAVTAALIAANQEAQKAAEQPKPALKEWGKTTDYAAESVAALTTAIKENQAALATQKKRLEDIKKANNLGPNDVEAYKKASAEQRAYFDLVTTTTATIARQEQQLADLRKKNAPAMSEAQKKAIDDAKSQKQSVSDLLSKLQEEFETYGMTNTQLLERSLRMKGATQDQIDFALSVQSGIDAVKQQAQDERNAAKAGEEMNASIAETAAGMEEWALAFEKTLEVDPAGAINDLKDSFAKAQPYIDAAASALGSIQQLIQNIGDEQLMRAEEELAANQKVWDDKLAKAEAEGATEEQLTALKAEQSAEIGKQEDDLNKKRKQIQRENAITAKAVALMIALVNAPAAIIKGFADGGWPLAIATGVATAVQIAAIAATPIPAAQFGGDFVVPPGYGGDSGLLRVNSGEQVSVTPARESGSSSGKTMILSIGGREFDAYIEEQVGSAMNSGRVTVRRSGVVRA
jgi:hypothetical protein